MNDGIQREPRWRRRVWRKGGRRRCRCMVGNPRRRWTTATASSAKKAKKESSRKRFDQQDRRRLAKWADARDGHNIPEDLAIRWPSAVVIPRSRHRLIVCCIVRRVEGPDTIRDDLPRLALVFHTGSRADHPDQPGPPLPNPPWHAHGTSLAPLRLNRVTGQSKLMDSFQIRTGAKSSFFSWLPFLVLNVGIVVANGQKVGIVNWIKCARLRYCSDGAILFSVHRILG